MLTSKLCLGFRAVAAAEVAMKLKSRHFYCPHLHRLPVLLDSVVVAVVVVSIQD